MENQQNPTKSIALTYGIYLAVASVLFHVALFAMGKHLEQDIKITVIGIAITAILIVLGIKKYKEANGGLLTLGQGIKTGIAIALISTVIYIIYMQLFLNVIAPDTMEQGLELARQKLEENPNLTEEQIEANIEIQKKFSSPVIFSGVMLIFSLFIGFVISLIASAVMQKKEEY